MNWGKGIVFFIVGFIITMVALVIFTFQQTNEMIDQNYYQKEMVYQNLIDARERLSIALNNNAFIRSELDSICFDFPKNTVDEETHVEAEFLRIDNQKLDNTYHFNSFEDNNIHKRISKQNLKKGVYKIRVTWHFQEQKYYYEKDIFIKK